mgnify:CR=1 FL=1
MAVNRTTAKQLREKRADLITKAQQIVAEKSDDQGLLGAEDQAAVDTMLADAEKFNEQAKQREDLQKAFDGLGDRNGNRFQQDPADDGNGDEDRRAGGDGAREGYVTMRCGFDRKGKPRYAARKAGARGSRAYHDAFLAHLSGRATPDQMATVIQSDSAERAGALLPSEQFQAELLKEVDDEVFIRQYAKVDTVPSADSLGIRKRTAKFSSFTWGPELQQPTEDGALKYGKRSLTPHYLSGAVPVSKDLLRRLPEFDSEIRQEIARDSGEVMEQAYLLGSGAQQPLGVFIPTADGISTNRDASTGSTTTFTAAALIAAKYKLKAAYRRKTGSRAGARWLFHRDGISKIAQLSDSSVGFLMRPGRGLQDEDSDLLLGLPIDESEFCPNTFTTGKYVGLLAQWAIGYRIADALEMELEQLKELMALTNQDLYLARLKTDGQPVLEEAFVRLKTD